MSLPFVSAAEVERRISVPAAADALEKGLLAGVDPEDDPAREIVAVGSGQMLVMPSGAAGHGVVKIVTAGGDPHVQGICVVFDALTLAPVALIDGIALTNVRTPAVSLVAARRLAPANATRLLIFGRGPQAEAHARAMSTARRIEIVDMVGRDRDIRHTDDLVAAADIICCCTTAREPLFNGELVQDHALVIAMGSHEPSARETDDVLASRATVVVESKASALREAGDVAEAIDSEALEESALVTLYDLVRGQDAAEHGKPRLFKSTGMAWEDAVVAAEVLRT
jgi:ornithine cyclodeaminase/alanine dehydrogenase-like protein (mu-crystallin family)